MSDIAVKIADNEAIYEQDFTPVFTIYVDGVLTTPSSATLTLYDSGEEVITDAACTVSESADETSYTIDSSYFPNKDESYRIELKPVISGVTYYFNFLIKCVQTKIYHSVTDDDLKKEHPGIASHIWSTQTTYSTQIAKAFQVVKDDLWDRKKAAYLLVDGTQVDRLVIMKTWEIIFYDFAKETGDIWYDRAKKAADDYVELTKSIWLRYDADVDGHVDMIIDPAQPRIVR